MASFLVLEVEGSRTKSQLAAGFTFTSKSVTIGEKYRVAIGGKASDDCNSAGGSTEGVAGGTSLTVEIKNVAQTMMACIPASQATGSPAGAAGVIQPANNVTFTVTVDRAAFSHKKPITVAVYDPTQAGQANPTPEETNVSFVDLGKPLTIQSSSVQVGEAFEVRVSGTAADGCNAASGTVQDTATEDTVTLRLDQIASTKIACLPSK
jgi:heat shock protein HslJ